MQTNIPEHIQTSQASRLTWRRWSSVGAKARHRFRSCHLRCHGDQLHPRLRHGYSCSYASICFLVRLLVLDHRHFLSKLPQYSSVVVTQDEFTSSLSTVPDLLVSTSISQNRLSYHDPKVLVLHHQTGLLIICCVTNINELRWNHCPHGSHCSKGFFNSLKLSYIFRM